MVNLSLKRMAFAIAMTCIATGVWAQVNLGDVPKEIKFNDASIETFGHLTMTVTDSVVFNTENRSYDTLRAITNMEWFTEAGTAKMRNQARNEGKGGNTRSDFQDGQSSSGPTCTGSASSTRPSMPTANQ